MRQLLTKIPELLILVGLYLAVSIAMTWPMGAAMGQEIVGGGRLAAGCGGSGGIFKKSMP